MICSCEFCELKSMFYGTISNDSIEKYCSTRHERKILAGEHLVKQGDPIHGFIYLKEGLVKLYRNSENGQTQIITFGKPFDFVSLLSVFSDEKYNYSIAAVEDSVACTFDLGEIKSLIQTNGAFAMHLIQSQN